MPNPLGSLTTSCVRLELRSLPPTGVTRLQRYYEPLRIPTAPGLSLAGVRLIIPDHGVGLPCCVRFPCVHAVATTPAQRLGVLLRSFPQPYQPSPKGSSGRPAHCPFRGLLGVHSRCGLHTRAVTNSCHANRRLQPLRYLHDCSDCLPADLEARVSELSDLEHCRYAERIATLECSGLEFEA